MDLANHPGESPSPHNNALRRPVYFGVLGAAEPQSFPADDAVEAEAGGAAEHFGGVAPGAALDGVQKPAGRALGVPGGGFAVVELPPEILRPLPYPARHRARAVGALAPGAAAHGRGLAQAAGEFGIEFIPPGVAPAPLAARGFFPLRLGGQPLAEPAAVGRRVVPADAGDGEFGAVKGGVARVFRGAVAGGFAEFFPPGDGYLVPVDPEGIR